LTTPSTIALDGPAASGKTTVGEVLARRLNYLLFDTGVMYRATTLMALRNGVAIEDEAAVTALAERLEIDVCPPTVDDGRLYTVLADNQDVTHDIRSPRVDAHVSPVSAYPGVRAALTKQQRRIGERGRVVMVGRDIGTVVLPDADLKIYLDATPWERARRRLKDCEARGERTSIEVVLAGVVQRDKIDSGRVHAPLRAAEDAVVIDSTGLSVEQVLARIQNEIARMRQVGKGCPGKTIERLPDARRPEELPDECLDC
jgi:cytidylate kinase